jgi:HD superfamily phosphohydrolase
MLVNVLRIRDLLHGFVYLTQIETDIVNHKFFQRLRHIRQNDVASYVYPSLNTTRFEHSIGSLSVAARMIRNMSHGVHWNDFLKDINLDGDDVQQIVRVYALLHDIGHLPLSHLFETGFEDYMHRTGGNISQTQACKEWFGADGFEKPHEALGARIAETIFNEVPISEVIKSYALRLLTAKKVPKNNPLLPLKHLIDSEIDADRVDSTARDGLQAGGEYGNYDIDRICRSAFLLRNETGWRLAYSAKALSSLEGLLFGRYRTYTHIHFHHRVVALKLAAVEVISKLFEKGIITKESLAEPSRMVFIDDPWLWSVVRQHYLSFDKVTQRAAEALLFRSKKVMTLLWKNRHSYSIWNNELRKVADLERVPLHRLTRSYEVYLREELNIEARFMYLRFSPLGNHTIHLCNERGSDEVGALQTLSPVAKALNDMWLGEPGYYIALLGEQPMELEELRLQWSRATAKWLDL